MSSDSDRRQESGHEIYSPDFVEKLAGVSPTVTALLTDLEGDNASLGSLLETATFLME